MHASDGASTFRDVASTFAIAATSAARAGVERGGYSRLSDDNDSGDDFDTEYESDSESVRQ